MGGFGCSNFKRLRDCLDVRSGDPQLKNSVAKTYKIGHSLFAIRISFCHAHATSGQHFHSDRHIQRGAILVDHVDFDGVITQLHLAATALCFKDERDKRQDQRQR